MNSDLCLEPNVPAVASLAVRALAIMRDRAAELSAVKRSFGPGRRLHHVP